MNYTDLWIELDTDPAEKGYRVAGVFRPTSEIETLINEATETVNRTSIETYEIIEATVAADYAALSTGEKDRYQTLVSVGRLDPWGANVSAAFQAMFAGTDTLANLVALRTTTASRASILGLGYVTSGAIDKVLSRFGGD